MLQFVTPLVKIRDNSTKGLSLTSSSSLSSLSTSFIQPLHDIEHENNTTEKGKKKKGKKTKPSLGQAINDPLVRSFYSLQEYEKYRRDQEQVEKRGSEIILILSLSPLSTLLLLILPLHPPPPFPPFPSPYPPFSSPLPSPLSPSSPPPPTYLSPLSPPSPTHQELYPTADATSTTSTTPQTSLSSSPSPKNTPKKNQQVKYYKGLGTNTAEEGKR